MSNLGFEFGLISSITINLISWAKPTLLGYILLFVCYYEYLFWPSGKANAKTSEVDLFGPNLG
jgi:hypothetical protein